MRHQTSSLAIGITLISSTILAVVALQAAPPGVPTCLLTPFHGITTTSEIGDIIGTWDPKDWGCANGNGNAAGGSAPTSGISGVPPAPPPSGICLLPASPNPATTAARLRLSLGNPAHVRLFIYGQTRQHGPRVTFLVRTLLEAQLMAGEHTVIWDAKDDAGVRVPAGIYRAVMEAGAISLCGDIEIR